MEIEAFLLMLKIIWRNQFEGRLVAVEARDRVVGVVLAEVWAWA